MKKSKLLLILLIVIIISLIIQTASAQDNSNISDIIDINEVQSIKEIDDCCENLDDEVSVSNEAKTWYVNPDPDNPNQVQKPTVQPAINQANSGDTIILNGTFVHCHFTINKTLTIMATPETTVGVCPHHNHPAGSDTFGIFYITPEANGTIIEGFSFTNNYFHIANVEQNPFAVLIDGASNIQLKNLSVDWTGVKSNEKNPEDYLFNPIIIKNSNNITLNNIFLNNTNEGISIKNSSTIKIENLTLIKSNSGIFIGENSSDISINYKEPEIKIIKDSELNINDLNIYGGDNEKLQITLTDSQNNPISGKSINVFINGETKIITTDENGIATLSLSFSNSGTYYVTASFLGDDDYKSSLNNAKIIVSKKTTSLTVSKKTFKVKSLKKVTITLKSNNSPLNGKKITIKVNGKTYSSKTNAKGIAILKVKISKKGKFTYKTSFAGNETYKSISKNGKIVVKK